MFAIDLRLCREFEPFSYGVKYERACENKFLFCKITITCESDGKMCWEKMPALFDQRANTEANLL